MTQCPSCQALVDTTTAAACPSCGWNFNGAGALGVSHTIRPAARPKIQCEVDLAITIDQTGSSAQFQSGIPLTAETILQQVAAKARNVRVWVQSHGDLDEGMQHVLHTDGGSPDQAVEDIKKIGYGGGGDPPEHHLDAVENLVQTVPWAADPRRARGALLAFMTADTKPAKSGITALHLGAEIQRRGLLLYLVCEPTPTLVELCNAAGGMMFQITNAPDSAELQRIASQLAASIVATVGSSGTLPMAGAAAP